MNARTPGGNGEGGAGGGAGGLNPYALSTWQRGQGSDGQPERARERGDFAGTRELGKREIRADEDRGEVFRENSGEAGVSRDDWEGLGIEPDPTARARDFSRGDEYARRALNSAKAAAKKQGYFPRRTRITGGTGERFGERGTAGYSGPGPDARDPQKLGTVLEKMLTNLGWARGMSTGRVLSDWETIVGTKIAEHSHIVSFDDGLLIVSADSSSWATQLRMMSPQIVTAIHEHVGSQVVSELRITGPVTKSWSKGKRQVKWRGVRDTYG